jgi:hypothetical protein
MWGFPKHTYSFSDEAFAARRIHAIYFIFNDEDETDRTTACNEYFDLPAVGASAIDDGARPIDATSARHLSGSISVANSRLGNSVSVLSATKSNVKNLCNNHCWRLVKTEKLHACCEKAAISCIQNDRATKERITQLATLSENY